MPVTLRRSRTPITLAAAAPTPAGLLVGTHGGHLTRSDTTSRPAPARHTIAGHGDTSWGDSTPKLIGGH